MTLKELWASGRIITDMARREGNKSHNCYLSMGHLSPEDAYKQPLIDGYVTLEDITANDWYIA